MVCYGGLTVDEFLVRRIFTVVSAQEPGDGADGGRRAAVAQTLLDETATEWNTPDDSFSSHTV